jgi:hypothetical protein
LTCGIDVVFPSLNIQRALPLNEAMAIEFTPSTTGKPGKSSLPSGNALTSTDPRELRWGLERGTSPANVIVRTTASATVRETRVM